MVRGTGSETTSTVITAARPRHRPASSAAAGGPAWFLAADRNGDGDLSPDEFLGPPKAFAKLDADGDGLISAAEASAAK